MSKIIFQKNIFSENKANNSTYRHQKQSKSWGAARYGGRGATALPISGVPTKRKCYCAISKVLEPRGHLTLGMKVT